MLLLGSAGVYELTCGRRYLLRKAFKVVGLGNGEDVVEIPLTPYDETGASS